jgi:hypothetical protein
MKQLSKSMELFSFPWELPQIPFPWEGVHLQDMIELISAFQQLWRRLLKEFLRTIWY